MTNKQKTKELFHKKFNECEECGGKGGTDVVMTDISGADYPDYDMCKKCSGKGYVIPLENIEKKWNAIKERHGVDLSGLEPAIISDLCDIFEDTLSLQDILRLLEEDYDEPGILASGEMFTSSYGEYNPSIQLDLTKDPSEWDEETWGQLYNILK